MSDQPGYIEWGPIIRNPDGTLDYSKATSRPVDLPDDFTPYLTDYGHGHRLLDARLVGTLLILAFTFGAVLGVVATILYRTPAP